ncbi:LAME_0F04302g1_1 [Lachancea meyersii CBS 8951]|uniref:LAME_0F04302g1_1 n=1 Tax=Lachancea meyersii CBS 8951 TaxID=1266667 RepID=A0A1G4JRX6_9SACH|nr:LAME_0F04302g1_1 [Lachancea meyersii CBS 8951]
MATYKKRRPSLYLLKSNSSAHFMMAQGFELQAQSEGSRSFEDLNRDEENQPTSKLPSFKYIHRRLLLFSVAIFMSWILVGLSVWRFQNSQFLLANQDRNTQYQKPRDRSFNMATILNGEFSYHDAPFAFIKSGALFQAPENDAGLYLSIDDSNGIPKYVAKKLADRRFYQDLSGKSFEYRKQTYEIARFTVSHRLDYAVMASNLEKQYRHSSQAQYWLKDIAKNIITPITPFPDDPEHPKLSYARLSPSGNFVYFVYNSDLYIQNVVNKAVRQLSFDGSEQVLNGKPDWVYEEEVLATDCAVWWAHDDSKLVWARFDDSKVFKEPVPTYTNDNPYDDVQYVDYPKPGTPNPEVSLFTYDVNTGALHAITQPDEETRILYHAQWLDASKFMFKNSDRASKSLSVKIHDLDSNMVTTVREIDASSFSGWIEKVQNVQVIPSKPSADRPEIGYVDVGVDEKGFPHLFYFSSVFSDAGRQLTSGDWEVTGAGIVGYDYDTDAVYFQANLQNRFSQHLYSVHISESSDKEIQTLQDPNEKNAIYEFDLSLSCRFGVKRYRGPDLPMSDAGDLGSLLQNDESRAVTQLTSNSGLIAAVDKFDMPLKNQKALTLDDGVEIDYMEVLPIDVKSTKKHPLLVHVYGGPGSHTADSSFAVSLGESLASSEGAVVLKIEPRGTGGRGWSYRSWSKGKLGFWEPRDVLNTVKKYMAMNADLIDPERVAIWGWSYGGYVTLKTLELDGGQTFKYGVAVAPVTNWKYYNSIYTERYMGDYEENKENYDQYALIKDVKSISKVQRLLLMHGSADDNVHLKNTMNLLDQMNLNNVQNYDVTVFPDSEHSIMYHNAGNVIYEKMFLWLKNAFEGKLDTLDGSSK